jgi:hypothetical protein
VRLGNNIEVANDVFIHLIATADIRYHTVNNWDFESRVRDRVAGRTPDNTSSQGGRVVMQPGRRPVSGWMPGIRKISRCGCFSNTSRSSTAT